MSVDVVELPDGTPLNLFCNKFMRQAVSLSRAAATTNGATTDSADGAEVLSPTERRRRRRETLRRLAEQQQQEEEAATAATGTAATAAAGSEMATSPTATPITSPIEPATATSAPPSGSTQVSFALPSPLSPLPPVQAPGGSPKPAPSPGSSKAVSFARELEAVRRIPSRRDFACANVGTASSGPTVAPLGPAATPDPRRASTPRKKKKSKAEKVKPKIGAMEPNNEIPSDLMTPPLQPSQPPPASLPTVTSPTPWPPAHRAPTSASATTLALISPRTAMLVAHAGANAGAALSLPEEPTPLVLPPRMGELSQSRQMALHQQQQQQLQQLPQQQSQQQYFSRMPNRRSTPLTEPFAPTPASGGGGDTVAQAPDAPMHSGLSSAGSSVGDSVASSRASSAAPSPVLASSLAFAPRSPVRSVASAGPQGYLARQVSRGESAPSPALSPSPAHHAMGYECDDISAGASSAAAPGDPAQHFSPKIGGRTLSLNGSPLSSASHSRHGSQAGRQVAPLPEEPQQYGQQQQRPSAPHDALAAALASMAGLRPEDSPPALFAALKTRRPITEQAGQSGSPVWGRASSVRASVASASPSAGRTMPAATMGAAGGALSPTQQQQHVRSMSEASPLSLPARMLLPDQAFHSWSGSGGGSSSGSNGASGSPSVGMGSPGSLARVSLNLSMAGGWAPVLSATSRLSAATVTAASLTPQPPQPPPFSQSQISSPRALHASHIRSPSRAAIADLTSSLYSVSRRDVGAGNAAIAGAAPLLGKRSSTGKGAPIMATYHTWSFTRSPARPGEARA